MNAPAPATKQASGALGARARAGTMTRLLIEEMKELRALGQPAGAQDVLARHPECAGNKQLLADLACEEFSLRRAAGEAFDAEDFAARFPDCGRSLRDGLVMRQYFDENPDLLGDEEHDVAWPEAGDMLLGFGLIRELGRGAFARVFLAAEPALGDRLVVLKVSPLDGAVEAETLGSLRHPNIVPVHSLHVDGDAGWTLVCMPYHGTATLDDLVERLSRRAALPARADVVLEVAAGEASASAAVGFCPSSSAREEQADVLRQGTYLEGVLHLGAQLADAVAYVHDRGICHRDLKPANVLLTPAGRPMLLDFNLSCDEDSADQNLGGTLPYMAPEQIQAMCDQGEGGRYTVDARADVFALGVILYELLTGRHPFGPFPTRRTRREVSALLLARQRGGPEPLRQANPQVDRGVARLVEACLAFDPAKRTVSARVLADTLRGRLSPGHRLKRRLRAHRRLLSAAAAAILLVGMVFSAYQMATAEPRNVRHLKEGQLAYGQRQYSEAVKHFSDVLDLEGDSAGVRFERGWAYFRLGNLPAAQLDYRKADELAGGKDGKIKASLAYSYTAQPGREMHEEAIWHYTRALEAGFKTARVYNNLGHSHVRRGHLEAAKVFFTLAIEKDPKLQAAYHNRMLITVQQGLPQAPQVVTFFPLAGRPIPVFCWGPTQTHAQLQQYVADRQRVDALLEEATRDMAKAVAMGPETADLYHDAALLCGFGRRSDNTLSNLGAKYVAKAIEHGSRPQDLGNDILLRMGLGHLPEFRRLVAGPPSGKTRVPCAYTVDPVPDGVH